MSAPLADRIRPTTLDDVVGQRHLLAPGKALRSILDHGRIPNLIFYGPSGVGKTTVARIIAERTDMRLHKLNGTTASTADIKAVVDELDTFAGVGGILLYLDEIQYFNKRQQQTLLEYIENGRITLIASTTENPYFYVYNAILSRSTVFEFKAVEPEEILRAVQRGFAFLREEQGHDIIVDPAAAEHIARSCGGDVRKALNAVELCALAGTLQPDGSVQVTPDTAKQLAQRSAMRYDREGDEHYDIVSAYQKSMRGSDPDAALHYLARLLAIVKAAVDIAQQVGLPEARIPLADAVVMVCQAPKSNAAYLGINAAMADVRAGRSGPIPRQLQNKHYDGDDVPKEKKGQFYLYPHDFPGHWVQQQYLPDALRGQVYYHPGDNKSEQSFAAYQESIRGMKKEK